MKIYSLLADKISKTFNSQKIFKNVSFNAFVGNSIAITGSNGSGKSTLLKILLKYIHPSKGDVKYFCDNKEIESQIIYQNISFVAPYFNLYEEFTALENIELAIKLKSKYISNDLINDELNRFSLFNHSKKEVGHYSSGMKQRLKYCIANILKSDFIFIDEPTSNLDDEGKKIVFDFLKEIQSTSCLIYATNEKDELQFANEIVDLSLLNLN
ncbi:MAG: ATP-binding cassette domain-containing protein [Bacteroidota bacterium]|mgnify:CR=1 FL=1